MTIDEAKDLNWHEAPVQSSDLAICTYEPQIMLSLSMVSVIVFAVCGVYNVLQEEANK